MRWLQQHRDALKFAWSISPAGVPPQAYARFAKQEFGNSGFDPSRFLSGRVEIPPGQREALEFHAPGTLIPHAKSYCVKWA